jgi:hypothetical protein
MCGTKEAAVDILDPAGTPIKSIVLKETPGKKGYFEGSWDWKKPGWNTSQDIPVGKYTAKFKVSSSGGYTEQDKYFYVYAGGCVDFEALCAQAGSDWVAAHNKYRCMHGVPPVSWDAKLEDVAKWRANNCQTCVHCLCQGANCQPQDAKQLHAENATCPQATAQQAVKGWYDEINNYDYNNPEFRSTDPMTGHFINVVVSVATKVGCFCTTKHCYCDYDSVNYDTKDQLKKYVLKVVNTEQFCQGATYSPGTGWTKQP